MKLFAVVLTSMFAMGAVACGKKAPEGGGTAAATAAGGGSDKGGGGDGDMPASCKKYTESVSACADKMGGGGDMMKDAMKKAMEGMKGMDKSGMETACKSAMDAAKQAIGGQCPDVKWE